MPDFTPEAPIVVHATPAVPQIAAGIRQAGAAVAAILTTLGFTVLAGKVGLVVSLAPQIATLVVIIGPAVFGAMTWLGQMATRHQAQKSAAMAKELPDTIASTK